MPEKKRIAAAGDEMSTSLNDISVRLVNARLGARPLRGFPGTLPATLNEAYEIQSLSIKRWPDDVSGWKVGGVPEALQQQFQADRLTGPIFRAATKSVQDAGTTQMSIFDGGFAAIEAEFVIRTNTSIAPDDTLESDGDLIGQISSLHIGAETASSPIADINRIGPVCIVSDFGNNAGLVVGPEISDWQSRLCEPVSVTVRIDGEVVGKVNTTLEASVLAAFRFLVKLSAARQITLPAGTLVSCGALSGIHEVTVGSVAEVDFAGLGSFELQFTKRRPAV